MRLDFRVEHDSVYAEQDRRLAAGFDYQFADARGTVRIGTTEADMRGWNKVTTWATVQLITQNFTDVLNIRTDSGDVMVTPAEWLQIINVATTFQDAVYQASFKLVDMDPIPADFAADKWWP